MTAHSRWTVLTATAFLAACAGGQTRFSGISNVPVSTGVECVADEVQEEGWTVVSRDEAGLLRAESGPNWIQATLVPGEGPNGSAHELRITTSGSDAARDVALELLEDCTNE